MHVSALAIHYGLCTTCALPNNTKFCVCFGLNLRLLIFISRSTPLDLGLFYKLICCCSPNSSQPSPLVVPTFMAGAISKPRQFAAVLKHFWPFNRWENCDKRRKTFTPAVEVGKAKVDVRHNKFHPPCFHQMNF